MAKDIKLAQDKKGVIRELIQEREDKIKICHNIIFRYELWERFCGRKNLGTPGNKWEQQLVESKNEIHKQDQSIKRHEEYINFLEEIKNEKEE